VSKAVKFPRAKILQWFALDKQRKKKEREAKSLKQQQEAIEKDLAPITKAAGGKIDREGFMLYFETKRGNVGWKEAYVKAKGDKAAEALIAAAPEREELVITRTAK
jgi:uncharacterized protein YktB (UPF0637 family)